MLKTPALYIQMVSIPYGTIGKKRTSGAAHSLEIALIFRGKELQAPISANGMCSIQALKSGEIKGEEADRFNHLLF